MISAHTFWQKVPVCSLSDVKAVFDAYEGAFDFTYDEEGYFIRVAWSRDL